jgi:transglutaminase-like putative cysteine protease
MARVEVLAYVPEVDYEYVISPGIDGVRETMYLMAKLARQGRSAPEVMKCARALTARVPQKSWRGEIEALYEFVRDRVRYTMDPVDVELVTSPQRLLEIRQGDCDDKSTLLAALLESVGHPARFHAIGFEPQSLEHVYVEARDGAGWLPLDTTEPLPVGSLAWNPADVRERFIIHV